MLNGPPGAIGEKFTVSQQGHEEVSHEQRPLCTEKQWVMQFWPYARMVVPSSFAAPQAPVIVIQGLVTL
jgi:hypothetical protein